MRAKYFQISEGWKWKERDTSLLVLDDAIQQIGWQDASAFPSEIHVELINAGKIPHPYVALNEHKVQWIGQTEWLYRCTFSRPEMSERSDLHSELHFEGLDTICDVYLNNRLLISTDNMFRAWKVQIQPTELAHENSLLLHFKSAQLLAKELEKKYGRVRAGSTNLGDPSRVYVRKAQYDWRWDWGPEPMTCGPWRPIGLSFYAVCLDHVHYRATVSAASLQPSLTVDFDLMGDIMAAKRALVRLSALDGRLIKEEKVEIRTEPGICVIQCPAVLQWSLDNVVELWWPVGCGSQTLYHVEVTLMNEADDILDSCRQRIGFRRVELLENLLEHSDQYGKGTTFTFSVNGVRMFAGGSNWIPADNFLTTISEDRYRAWLTAFARW